MVDFHFNPGFMTDKQRRQLERAFRESGEPAVLTGSHEDVNPKFKRPKLEKGEANHLHSSAVHFVAAELCRRGYAVAMTTTGNTNTIDLFAYKNNVTLPVRVHAIKNKNSAGWPVAKSNPPGNVVYVFVNLNDHEAPEYYLLSADDVKANMQKEGTANMRVSLVVLQKKKFGDKWEMVERGKVNV